MTDQLAAAPPATWQELMRAGSGYVALPSRRRPVVVAEDDPGVLHYVRTSLLARPPRSRLPGWAFRLGGQALRLPGVGRLLPAADVPAATAGRPVSELSRLTVVDGRRLVVLLHSRDADASCVLLLFPPGENRPDRAVKL